MLEPTIGWPDHDVLPVVVALARLADNAGTQFDPQVVDALLRMVRTGSLAASPARHYAVVPSRRRRSKPARRFGWCPPASCPAVSRGANPPARL